MYSLFCEAKFWSLRNDLHIRDTDFGAFRYYSDLFVITIMFICFKNQIFK